MKKILCGAAFVALLAGCNEAAETKTETTAATAPAAAPMEMPYKATYSSNWTSDVSDADLHTVLMTYKDWETGDMTSLASRLADTIDVDMSSGDRVHLDRAALTALWGTYRDSLSSVVVEMAAYHKMKDADKKEDIIVTWYKEIDTYKNGKVDSAVYHDINMLKDGKIVWYSQYKRPLK